MPHAGRPWRAGIACLMLICLLLTPALSQARPRELPNPDFTKGGSPPAWANHTWNLGATGLRGWMWSNLRSTRGALQIDITKVDKGSPADGIIKVGDVILGVGGKRFSHDARVEFGQALTRAETRAGGGKLSLIRWRAGETKTVVVPIQVMGSYGPTAPYHSPKSQLIIKQGCEAIAREMADPSYTRHENAITRSLNAMALLGSGNPKYLPLVRKEAQWASNFSSDGFATWWYGYTMMFLAEYVHATGDHSVMPGLRRMALEAANGQSMVGSWGHKFAGPDGRCQGYGMMNEPGIPLTISLVEARAAGVNDAVVSRAIERSARLLSFYIGKGCIPYGDHRPWMQTHTNNGKEGMAALLFDLLGNKQGATFFSRMSVASYGSERDAGHTGNFFGILWSLPGVAISGPQAAGAWMKVYGDWYFDLARRWNGTFVYLGKPQAQKEVYANWDTTGAYLLSYEMPLHKLWFTGSEPWITAQLTKAQAQKLIADGKGWNTVDRSKIFYDKLNTAELMQRLSNWSPIVRSRAAMALGRRRDQVSVKTLITMLNAQNLDTRLGACTALGTLGSDAAPAVPALGKLLSAKDLWLRIKAAEALADMGEPGMVALPQMLRMLAQGPTPQDPRNMQQRYLCFAVFGKMLRRHSLQGVNPQLLREAVAAGLKNQDGRARGEIGGIYQQLDYQQIKPLLPAIRDAVAVMAPSGIMFASGIRIAGLQVLEKYHIRQGMALCLKVMSPHKWGQGQRIPKCLAILARYGAAAKPLLPQLREEQKQFQTSHDRKETKVQKAFRETIEKIQNATTGPQLRDLPESS